MQGLLEFNLFSSNLETMGDYTVMELLGMLEPVWDSGIRKVGEFGARGWGAQLQQLAGTEPLHNQVLTSERLVVWLSAGS